MDASSKLAYYIHNATKLCQWTKPKNGDPEPVAVQHARARRQLNTHTRARLPPSAAPPARSAAPSAKLARRANVAALGTAALVVT